MRIVALEPFVTDILSRFGSGWKLVGVSHLGGQLPSATQAVVLTRPLGQRARYGDTNAERLARGLSRYPLEVEHFKTLAPDVVLAEVCEEDKDAFILWAEEYLASEVGQRVAVLDVSVNGLDAVYRVIEELGGLVGNRVDARRLASNIKAQLMHWADSFFGRCRGKQVAVLSGIEPLTMEGRWFPDLIRLLGAKSIDPVLSRPAEALAWAEIVKARIDVLVVAPENYSIAESVKTLSILQILPGWDDIPAVKRGEVIFASGTDLYRPGPRFLKGAAIVVSAIAGLDSGYITERDEYFKVRYLELHRHRFL
ncbi:MAG: ABC transporter substrate-binding protein [Pseudomonadota bacterium]